MKSLKVCMCVRFAKPIYLDRSVFPGNRTVKKNYWGFNKVIKAIVQSTSNQSLKLFERSQ